MMRMSAGLIFGMALLGAGLLQAEPDSGNKPDLSGKWELNVGKSKFGKMPAPTRMTLESTKRGSTFHSVQSTYDQAGGPNAVEGDWFMDGKQHPIGSDGKMTSMSKWDGNTIVSERRSKDGTYDELIRVQISDDGKTATEDIKLKSPNGNNSSTLVWDRK